MSSNRESFEEEKSSGSAGSNASSPRDTEYRMVRKAYMCHMCEREFKQIAPVNDLVEVECPRCHQTFVEELSTVSLTSNAANSSSSGQKVPQA